MERAVPNGFDSKHSYFNMILFDFLQFMPMVSTKINMKTFKVKFRQILIQIKKTVNAIMFLNKN